MQEKEFVEKWSKKLSDPVTVEELPDFLTNMLKDSNDYGSIARALGYGAAVTESNGRSGGAVAGYEPNRCNK